MAGVPIGECRLTMEIGDSRFVVHAQTGSKASNATTLLAFLPILTRDMRAQLERVRLREQQARNAR